MSLTNSKNYFFWIKTLRKYKKTKQILSTTTDKKSVFSLTKKLKSLEKRILRLRKKYALKLGLGLLMAWFANPTLAQTIIDVGSDLNGSNGFKVTGDNFGRAEGLGDINGDGIDDFILDAGSIDYVVFGSENLNFGLKKIDVNSLKGSNGFILQGFTKLNFTGDFNGDGLNDIIGAGSGSVQLIFGSKSSYPDTLRKTDLDGINGFILSPKVENTEFGKVVSGVGDLNNDGYGDISISSGGGVMYTYFGHSSTSTSNVVMPELNGDNGFVVHKSARNNWSFYAGDLNNDGIDDMLSGAQYTFFRSVLGKEGTFEDTLSIRDITEQDDLLVDGKNSRITNFQGGGFDINGDGFDDVGAGVYNDYYSNKGHGYVVFGGENRGEDSLVNPINITERDGIHFEGIKIKEYGVSEVALVPDINADGFDDIVLTTLYHYYEHNAPYKSYVIFGSDTLAGTVDVSKLTPEQGFEIEGFQGGMTRSLGDINGDGGGDFIITKGSGSYIFLGEPNITTGLFNSLNEQEVITLFPNPVKQDAVINFNTELTNITVTDMQGHVIMKKNKGASINSSFKTGIYILVSDQIRTKIEVID